MADETNSDITALTVQLLSAFVSNNSVSSDGLAELIKTTRSALTQEVAAPAAQAAAEEFAPAVSVRKSLASRDHILSLIDGKPYKTLKRHLAQHGLTPEQYRERYKLPKTYPLVAPSYSDARRAVAEKLGLGKKPVAAPVERAASVPAPTVAPVKAPVKAATPKASPAPVAKAEMSSKPTKAATTEKAAPRKRLSIATPKAEKPAAVKAEASVAPSSAPKSEVAKTAKPKTAAKAKPATKAKAAPKTKAAKGDAKPAAPTPVEAKAPEAAAAN
ncbi:transcriptional regulator [Sphingobium sp. TB-6]|uniref:MucR family transcriptional regulator n=1 Tax=Sphingobium sp. TB-6 TaxID=2728850 RepID=UPI00146A3FC4|nr:MucR family transcriptional regulator [Sphingobium sp. TB-6]NML91675.1 transcriptional regulator [Sphingobium sp. TB-6]